MTLKSPPLVRTALLSLLVACSGGKTGQDAEVTEALAPGEIPEKAEIYAVDAVLSVVTWIGSKPTGQHNGIIGISDGKIGLLNDTIVGGDITIDINSLEDKDLTQEDDRQKLEGHLMSDDFFAAQTYPEATFTILKVDAYDSASMQAPDQQEFESEYAPAVMSEFTVAKPTHRITGNLTMRGVTKGISFPAVVRIREGKIMAEAKFNINRTDWGLSYSDEASVADKTKDKFIYNTVNVGFSLQAKK